MDSVKIYSPKIGIYVKVGFRVSPRFRLWFEGEVPVINRKLNLD